MTEAVANPSTCLAGEIEAVPARGPCTRQLWVSEGDEPRRDPDPHGCCPTTAFLAEAWDPAILICRLKRPQGAVASLRRRRKEPACGRARAGCQRVRQPFETGHASAEPTRRVIYGITNRSRCNFFGGTVVCAAASWARRHVQSLRHRRACRRRAIAILPVVRA